MNLNKATEQAKEQHTEQNTEQEIVDSWLVNSKPWISAISQSQIQSRVAVTNQAIIDAVLKQKPKTVLDVGCGEGWLARALVDTGTNIDVLGVDVSPELISHAQQAGAGRFQTLAYEDLSVALLKSQFDVVVANFSMLGKISVDNLFKQIPGLLKQDGHLIVQTIHPVSGCGDATYQDGWRTGSWAGFSDDFSQPAPWYFRTLDSWLSLFADSGFRQVERLEPLHPDTKQPASVIFVAKV